MIETCMVCKEVVHISRKGIIHVHRKYIHGVPKPCLASGKRYKYIQGLFGGYNEEIQTKQKEEQKELPEIC